MLPPPPITPDFNTVVKSVNAINEDKVTIPSFYYDTPNLVFAISISNPTPLSPSPDALSLIYTVSLSTTSILCSTELLPPRQYNFLPGEDEDGRGGKKEVHFRPAPEPQTAGISTQNGTWEIRPPTRNQGSKRG